MSLSYFHRMKNNFEKAEEVAQDAEQLLRHSGGNSREEAKSVLLQKKLTSLLGRLYFVDEQYEPSLFQYKKLVEVLSAQPTLAPSDVRLLFSAYINMGSVFFAGKQYSQAKEIVLEGFRAIEGREVAISQAELAKAYENLGKVNEKMGLIEESMGCYDRMVELEVGSGSQNSEQSMMRVTNISAIGREIYEI